MNRILIALVALTIVGTICNAKTPEKKAVKPLKTVVKTVIIKKKAVVKVVKKDAVKKIEVKIKK